jgi:hypothetical protein
LIKKPPVEKSLIVLDIIARHTAGVHVNQIWRDTGSKDKKGIIGCLDFLEKADIIRTEKTRGSQKELKILTDIGVEMATLRDGIARYRKAYLQLDRAITTRPPNIKSRLLATGWKPAEISSYGRWAKEASQFKSDSSYAFILALCAKYVQLLSEIITSGNNNPPQQQVLLTKIFTDALNDHFAPTSRPSPSDDGGGWILISGNVTTPIMAKSTMGELENPARKFVTKYLKMRDPIPLKNNKFIKDESAEVVASIRYIMDAISVTKQHSGGIYLIQTDNNNNRRHDEQNMREAEDEILRGKPNAHE